MATHSSLLGWRIVLDRGAWWATVHGVAQSETERLRTAQQYGGKAGLFSGALTSLCVVSLCVDRRAGRQ